MNLKPHDHFFKELGGKLRSALTLVVTGGVAGAMLGGTRPTEDLDFGVLPRSKKAWIADEETLNRVASKHGLPIQYAQDISRWSMISYLDWKNHTQAYKKFSKLEVRVLDPLHWSIGKISRGLKTDLDDIVAVFKAKKIKANDALKVWARALKSSPKSSDLFNVKKQVLYFTKDRGNEIWGKGFDSEAANELFEKLMKVNR